MKGGGGGTQDSLCPSVCLLLTSTSIQRLIGHSLKGEGRVRAGGPEAYREGLQTTDKLSTLPKHSGSQNKGKHPLPYKLQNATLLSHISLRVEIQPEFGWFFTVSVQTEHTGDILTFT